MFERINTGGMRLSPQEIRACVSFGDREATEITATVNGGSLIRA